MLEQRLNEMPVLVELSGLANEGITPSVRARSNKALISASLSRSDTRRNDAWHRSSDANARAPAGSYRELGRVEPIAAQRIGRDVGCDRSADQAVVDAAPVVGLTSPAASPTTRRRSSKCARLARAAASFCRGASPPFTMPHRDASRATVRSSTEQASVVAMTPDAYVGRRSDGRPAPPRRILPGDGGAEMQLDIARVWLPRARAARFADMPGAYQGPSGAGTRSLRRTRGSRSGADPGVAGDRVHTAVLHRERGNARARTKVDARRARLLGEALVERAPIDDDGLESNRGEYATDIHRARSCERSRARSESTFAARANSSKLSVPSTPVQCTGSPTRSCSSNSNDAEAAARRARAR